MKKAWALLIIAVVITAQWILISSFDSVSTSGFTSGTGAVVILKAKYAFVRVDIQVFLVSQNSSVRLVFSDGSQRKISGQFYSFDMSLPRSGSFAGGFFASDSKVGIGVSDESPIGVAVLSNLSENYTYEPPGPYFLSNRIDAYWFRIEGNARVTVNLYGMAI